MTRCTHAMNVLKLIGISPKRRLRCSFCWKTDREVSKLLAGPRVFICDECVAICNGILEATPKKFAGWERMSDAELLSTLKPAAAIVDGSRNVLQAHVNALRQRGTSWEAIGSALGISRQAAWGPLFLT
jgi:hypothetical protein